MTIGQNIRALRKKKGLTQAQLGGLCGISGGAVGSYENGITVPKRRGADAVQIRRQGRSGRLGRTHNRGDVLLVEHEIFRNLRRQPGRPGALRTRGHDAPPGDGAEDRPGSGGAAPTDCP